MPESTAPDPAALLASWDEANRALIEGMQWAQEIVVRTCTTLPSLEGLWGTTPPEGVPAVGDPGATLTAVRACGYLARGGQELLGLPARPERAEILLDRALVTDEDAIQLQEFVRRGGTIIAFGHASRVGSEDGALRPDYALADVFGAHYKGLVQFETEASRVTLSADSTYAPQFSPPNVVDGKPDTFWASVEAGPMPHWVQLDFPKPRRAAAAQVSCRPGFLLKDFEVQAKRGEEWQTLAAVADNKDWVIDCPFAAPVESATFRLFITREELNGENRVIADVGEFTLLDERGARLIPPPYLVDAHIADKTWGRANRSNRLLLRSPAVRIEPRTAKPLATFPDPVSGAPVPLCTLNRVGKGRAYLLAVPEAAFGYAPETWDALLRPFIGPPAIRHSGDEKVIAYLRQAGGRAILHVIDTAPAETADRAKEAIVRLDLSRVGRVKTVRILPARTPLPTHIRQRWMQFTMPIDPMGSVLLETGQ